MDIRLTGNNIVLTNTTPDKLDSIVEFECSSNFIGKNTVEEHLNLINDPDCLHLTVLHVEDKRLVGHIILNGIQNKNKSLEFRRIFINEKGKGFGRESINLIKKICFNNLNYHRLWLDVHVDNNNAIQLYESENFIKEGTLREAILTENGFKSIYIYSIMEQDYQKEIVAEKFGKFLDQDDFENFKSILTENCIYEIGDQVLITKDSIAGLYEKNMKEGKAKFDELLWGKSKIKKINENQFDVYFSDFLKHKGIEHNYKCKQRITVSHNNLVEKITHMELPGESESLKKFYNQVGLS